MKRYAVVLSTTRSLTGVRRPNVKAERLRPARCSSKIAYQRGGPKSAPATSWAAAALVWFHAIPAEHLVTPRDSRRDKVLLHRDPNELALPRSKFVDVIEEERDGLASNVRKVLDKLAALDIREIGVQLGLQIGQQLARFAPLSMLNHD